MDKAKKIYKHMQANGEIATRGSARAYTHVVLVRTVDIEVEVAKILRNAAEGYERYDTWTEEAKAESRARDAARIEWLRAHGRDFHVYSWHGSERTARGPIWANHEYRVEAINHGVRS